jgi:uncharacterized DUF497 family protein
MLTAIVGVRSAWPMGIAVLFVVHTDPVVQLDGREIGRIISVRKASACERRAYEEDGF